MVNCREDPTRLWLYAAEALEPAEAQAVAAHLRAGCPVCERELAAAEQSLNQVLLSVEPTRPPIRVKHQLISAVSQSRQPPVQPVADRPLIRSTSPVAWTRRAAMGAAAVVIFSVLLGGSGLVQHISERAGSSATSRLDRLQAELSQQREALAISRERLDRVSQRQTTRESVVQLLQSDQAQIVPLTGAAGEKAWGRLLWDQTRRQGYIVAQGLKPAAQDETYTLWLTTETGRALAVRSFKPNEKQAGLVAFKLPAAAPRIQHIQKASISIDPAGGVEKPHQPMLSGHFSVAESEP
jgi:hypothetical protein